MSIADKLSTIAENEQKVYDAGYEKGKSEGGVSLSSITNWSYMFGYSTRQEILKQLKYSDTSNGVCFNDMFRESCGLTEIPPLDTSNGIDFSSMFFCCESLTEIPPLDTSNGREFYAMFMEACNLRTIPRLNLSKATGLGDMFYCCESLENVNFEGTIPITQNLWFFDYSPNLTVDSLMSFINALSDNTNLTKTYTVSIGSTNLAKLTEEQKAVATNKNIKLA